MAWVRICAATELPAPGEMRACAAGASELCVANQGGVFSVVDNICPHRGGPLAEGWLEDGKVLCPWHAWAFDLKTGAADHAPGQKIRVYALRVENGEASVDT